MANALTAYNPQLWANESVAILVESLVTARLVHTDFKNEIAESGDIVNTRKPAEFTAVRKALTEDVSTQNATATNIQVKLDQHWHTSFLLRDGELSKSFKDLKQEYLGPAITSIAQAIDKVLLGQVYQFLANTEGQIGDFSSSTAKGYILDVRKEMNINKVPLSGRNLMLTPTLETETLKLDLFVGANTVGDEGTALREASLGRKLGFDIFQVQNAPSVTNAQSNTTPSTALVDNASGYAAGATLVHIDTAGASIKAGMWCTFESDKTLHQITAIANIASEDLDLTLDPPLFKAIANDDTVDVGAEGAIDGVSYLEGEVGELVVDGFTGSAVQVGQLVSFGITAAKYAVVAFTETAGDTTGITVDRPLEADVADGAAVQVAPGGEFGFAFDRNALALISRPLALPDADLGARSAVAEFNGYGIRVVMSYDAVKQGVRITVDILAGVKVLDVDRGVVLIG